METFSILVFVVQWLVQFDLQSECSGFHSSYVEFSWSFCAHTGCLRAINCSLVSVLHYPCCIPASGLMADVIDLTDGCNLASMMAFYNHRHGKGIGSEVKDTAVNLSISANPPFQNTPIHFRQIQNSLI